MPDVISREEALARLDGRRGCVVCAQLDGTLGKPWLLAAGAHAVAFLPRYASRWGHVMVALREHVVRFGDLDDEAWREASDMALGAARTLERALTPVRCYIASLGTARDDLPMTSPHLHLHVIPLYDPDDKPSTVLSWSHGVHVAPETEWARLAARLVLTWRGLQS
jgi:diadenosine tetraphosphate (Ap4A) HIT family hydrolase